jgi:hypothetical protein
MYMMHAWVTHLWKSIASLIACNEDELPDASDASYALCECMYPEVVFDNM